MPRQEVRADLLLGKDTLSPGLIKAGAAASDASGNIKQLTRDLYEVSRQRATPVVDLDDAAAETKLKDVTAKLKELGARAANPEIDVDDKQALAEVAGMRVKLDQLGAKVSSPRITLDGLARAEAQLLVLDVALDKIDAKHVTATVDVNVNRQGLRGLLSRLGGGGGEGGGGLFGIGQSGVGSLGLPVLGGGIAGAGLIGAGLVPGVVGAGLGGAVGAGAVAGGLFGAAQGKKQLDADLANIKSITTRLKGAIGGQKQVLSQALKDANKQYQKDARFFQPFTTFQASIQNLSKTILTVLRPVMAPLTGIFNQFGKGLAALGPQFTALFQASLPFVKQFLQFMLQAGKILLPAFTQALNEMVKSGALKQMTGALVILTRGLATFIVNLGPGMAASAVIFARVATFIGRILGFLGSLFTVIAKVLAFDFPGAAKKGVNAVMASFDAFRHAIAASLAADAQIARSVWDAIWRNTITRAANGVRDAVAWFTRLRSSVAAQLAAVRGAAASIWDTIWRNTVTRARNGISDVVGWFRTLPGRAVGVLTGLGSMLYNFAHQALVKFGNGAKAVWNSIVKWFKGLPATILHALGIHSPPDWAISAGRHVMQGILNGLHLGSGGVAGFIRGLPGKIGALLGGGKSGAIGGDALANQKLARRIFPWGAAQWPAFVNLVMAESGFNRFARNPSSGAYGIPQALPPSKLPFAGQAAGGSHAGPQLSWMFNYIRGRYGTPANAWGHEVAYRWYDQGGILPPGLTLALNTTGHPEQVISGRSGPAPAAVVLEIRSSGRRADDLLVELIRDAVRVRGGGNVQVALGKRN